MNPRAWVLIGLAALALGLLAGGAAVALKLIKRFEGLRLQVYLDTAGRWTIGWGHLVKPGDPYHPYGSVTEITEADADALLTRDLATAEAAVTRLVQVPLTQNQHDALVSFTFNLGEGALAGSTLLKKLNTGDYAGAAGEFDRWVHERTPDGVTSVSDGLVARRAQEKEVFLTG